MERQIHIEPVEEQLPLQETVDISTGINVPKEHLKLALTTAVSDGKKLV